MSKLYILTSTLCFLRLAICYAFPEINIKDGTIRGICLNSRNNRTFYAFKGIPYAKPPVGDLRFKAPQPVSPWNGVLNATTDAVHCIQKNILFPPLGLYGEEDCLFLNVYTPQLPSRSSVCKTGNLPVLVFIHYGGFYAGSGRSDLIGPEYFMDENVVLVTFNYRLGVFGFLSTEDDAAPGNWALKDQVAVLRWVQDNIGYFGGDRNLVTIFGESAGSASVHFHLLSPMSKGLFHRAASQSGTALSLFAKPIPGVPLMVTRQQAEFVGCKNDTDTITLVECLRKIDANELADSVDNFKFFADEPGVVYMPAIETKSELNPEPFITEDPVDIIKAGKFHNVSWIVGFMEHEGLVKASALLRQTQLREELIANFDNYGPLLLGVGYSVPPNRTDSIWSQMKEFYLGRENIDVEYPQTLQGFIDLYGDRHFTYASYRAVELHANAGHKSIWTYYFTYRGQYTFGDAFAQTNETIENVDWGASHTDDLLYLFPSPQLFPSLTQHSSDHLLSNIFIRIWTDFAKYGDPSVSLKINWSATSDSLRRKKEYRHFEYLKVSGSYVKKAVDLALQNSFLPERMRFWESLPLYENILFNS